MADWKKDKVYQQLRRLPKSQLIEMAGEFNPPVEFGSTWNRNMIAAAIRRRQIADNDATQAGGEPQDSSVVKDNPELEAALQDDPGEDTEVKKDGRGGARPGAGRPAGMTDELAKVDRALRIEQPNRTVKAALKLLFEAWAIKTGVSLVALSEEEAIAIAIPYTQILELHGLTKFIPHELEIYILAAWTTYDIVKAKRQLIIAAKGDKKPVESEEVKEE